MGEQSNVHIPSPRSPLRSFGWLLYFVAIGGFLVFCWNQGAQYNAKPVTITASLQQSAGNTYMQIAQSAAIEAGIDPGLFVKQIQQESGFNPKALSPMGAEGIAQFMPQTAAALHIDPWNPQDALNGAARLMAHYLADFNGRYDLALASYNANERTVNGCLHTYDWFGCLPTQTQHYILVIYGQK